MLAIVFNKLTFTSDANFTVVTDFFINVMFAVVGCAGCISIYKDIQLEQWYNIFQHDNWQSDTWQQAAV